jgi:hypothetical protein
VKNAHSLKYTVPRIDDAGNYTTWKAIGRVPSATLQERKKHLQYELICDDCKFATLGLKIWRCGDSGG